MRRRIAVVACLGAPLLMLGVTGGPALTASNEAEVAAHQVAAPKGLATGPLRTGIVDVAPFLAPDAAVNFAHVRAAGSTVVRLTLFWRYLGPIGSLAEKPPNFRADDPGNPNYAWESFDRVLVLARRAGLEPIVTIQAAPQWAERGAASSGDPGTRNPDPVEFAAFARAAARRYSGTFGGLPRVRNWQVWNEPNFSGFLNPQSPELYRQLVNAMAAAVRGVHRDNVVIAGGMSPFAFPKVAAAPMKFMRELLCVSGGAKPRKTCSKPITFDVWAHHPYTTGGPMHRAQKRDDASLGDLPEMRSLLEAAIRSGNIVSRRKIQFWVTEFSWDTRPPDPVAVPEALHARWVSEALYRMWKAGVSTVTWFQIRDEPLAESVFQSGLYSTNGPSASNDKPKRALRAFRFPFVALRSGSRVDIWGRTPYGRRATVVVERRAVGWKQVARLRTNGYGIFQARLVGGTGSSLRARIVGDSEASLPFALKRPPDRYFWPFGCGGVLPCG